MFIVFEDVPELVAYSWRGRDDRVNSLTREEGEGETNKIPSIVNFEIADFGSGMGSAPNR